MVRRLGRKLVVLDADSTLIENEVIALLAAEAGSLPLVNDITERAMRGEVDFSASLRERVAKLLHDRTAAVSEADVAREVALMADRTDVAEELVRLASHVAQFDRLLDEESPGRALDFLAQEMGREANTIASKSLDVGIAHAVVEIKTRIERLREQAQNVE
jgi:uncharacterized protein (TIGR00255 family)